MPTTQRPSTSLSLLKLVKEGDTQAWSRMTDLYGPVVYHACRYRGLEENDARDVTQEVFLSIYKGMSRFERSKANHSFLRWVRAITRNKIADFYASAQKNPNAIGGSGGVNMLQKLVDSDDDEVAELDQMHRHLVSRIFGLMKQDFEETTWRAFYMTMVEGLTTQETAEKLGMSAGAIRIARMRVRNRLKEEFEHVFDE